MLVTVELCSSTESYRAMKFIFLPKGICCSCHSAFIPPEMPRPGVVNLLRGAVDVSAHAALAQIKNTAE